MTQGSVQISNAEYHKHFAVSASMIKVMDKHGPRAYWNSFLNPDRPEKKSTPALILGSLTHATVLEPEDLENQFPPHTIHPKEEINSIMYRAGQASVVEYVKKLLE